MRGARSAPKPSPATATAAFGAAGPAPSPFHLVPLAEGGTMSLDGLTTLCEPCHHHTAHQPGLKPHR